MSILEDFEKRNGLEPLTPDQVLELIGDAESYLMSPSANPFAPQRTLVWLSDRLQAVYAALENPKSPVKARCSYCWRAEGSTDEAWRALPEMGMDDACLHAQVCEHNPLVRSIARISHDRDAALAQVADLQGRKLGNGNAWAEAASEATGMYDYQRRLHEAMKATIRSLLATELPAGELRKAIAELVR